jgi:hypothetical protein
MMCEDFKTCEILLKIFLGWEVSAISANEMSGGLGVAWNPLKTNFKYFKCCAGLLLKGRFRGLVNAIKLINFYAPFSRRIDFWDKI